MSNCAREETISQYVNSPKAQGWLNSYSDRVIEICEAYHTLELFFAIDSASGLWLDLLGVIIGQPRVVIDGDTINYFSMDNLDPLTSGFNVGKFWDGTPIVEGNILVNDITYRKLIKARAFKNGSGATVEDILTAVELLLDRTDCQVIDGGLGDSSLVTPDIMQYALEFDEPIDGDDKFLILALDLLPRPTGVEITTVIP